MKGLLLFGSFLDWELVLNSVFVSHSFCLGIRIPLGEFIAWG